MRDRYSNNELDTITRKRQVSIHCCSQAERQTWMYE